MEIYANGAGRKMFKARVLQIPLVGKQHFVFSHRPRHSTRKSGDDIEVETGLCAAAIARAVMQSVFATIYEEKAQTMNGADRVSPVF